MTVDLIIGLACGALLALPPATYIGIIIGRTRAEDEAEQRAHDARMTPEPTLIMERPL